jgi:hypothetical protein
MRAPTNTHAAISSGTMRRRGGGAGSGVSSGATGIRGLVVITFYCNDFQECGGAATAFVSKAAAVAAALLKRRPHMNKKIATAFIMAAVLATTLLAHGGHAHKVLGTIKSLKDNARLTVTTKDKKEVIVKLTQKTKITHGSDVVNRSHLKAGTRVSIELADDGKTATAIKIGGTVKSGK